MHVILFCGIPLQCSHKAIAKHELPNKAISKYQLIIEFLPNEGIFKYQLRIEFLRNKRILKYQLIMQFPILHVQN